jgi:hypothetical protein
MKTMRLRALILLAVGLLSSLGLAATVTGATGDPSVLRVLSLRVLQERVQSCRSAPPCPREVRELGGMTRLVGYVVDADRQDLLLLGTVAEGAPLQLDDLVTGLRSVFERYAEQRGNTRYLSAPGCTIDPDSAVIRKLQRIGDTLLTPGQSSQAGEAQWRKACEMPQQVRFFGVPESHFAHVMVTADYDLKRIVDGVTKVPVEGLIGVTGLILNEVQQRIAAGEPITAGASMNRFWFTAGVPRFLEAEGIVTIERLPVELKTEAEFVHANGDVSGRDEEDPTAATFARAFTERYPQVAVQVPIYAELENLYRFVGLLTAMKFRGAHAVAGVNLAVLLDDYQVPRVAVAPRLPGRSNIARFSHREDQPGGYMELKLLLPSCGGVEMDIRVSAETFDTLTPAWRRVGGRAIGARPSARALYWDLELQEVQSSSSSSHDAQLSG